MATETEHGNIVLRREQSPMLGDLHTEKRHTDGKYLVCSGDHVLLETWLYSEALRYVAAHLRWARQFA